ncbi:MAG: hypothetical protein WC373_10785 [Smithella sp.]
MTTVLIAQTIGGERTRHLHIQGIAELTADANHREVFEHDAGSIFNALLQSLPGGTLDALLRKMIEHRASSLVVPFK